MGDNETFNYTYSAKQQEEINAIRDKYLPKAPQTDREAKLQQLRQLDASADRAGKIVGILIGAIAFCLFALGMVCVTSVWAEKFFAFGVVIGAIGLGGMAVALPVSRMVTARKREQIAPEVLKLTDELSQEI